MTLVLVTGGTGLVGARLLRRFVAAGIPSRGLVRPGKALPEGVQVAEGDLLDPAALGPALQDVTAVVHLAALFRTQDEQAIRRANLDGTRNLIAAVQEHARTARLLMASTSNVYDADGAGPARETDDLHPVLAYPASKVAAEEALRASGLTWAVLRLPFVYGDGDGHLEALPAQLQRMGWHPAQRLSTAHHEDVAAAFRLALTGAMDGRTVNIADDAALSVLELARLAGADLPPSDEPVMHPWRGVADASLARSLGFRPVVRTVRQAVDEDRL